MGLIGLDVARSLHRVAGYRVRYRATLADMSSALYPSAIASFLGSGTRIDLDGDTIKVVAIDSADYTYSSSHDFLDDVPSGARIGTPQTLASVSLTAGVFDAADATFPSVTGDPFEALIIYKDTGTESTSPLIAYIDGLSCTPNGGNITVQWDNGASKIFKIG